MTFQQKLVIMSALSAIIGAGTIARMPGSALRAGPLARFGGVTAVSLAIVAIALAAVGVVSHTPIRHAVQITPVVVALILAIRRSSVANAAAAPVFAFWLVIMGAIWLFLLGLARIVSGTFTAVEILLTIVIGLASVVGLAAAYRRGSTASAAVRFATVIFFAIFQFAAMWLSVQPYIARR